MRTVIRSVEVPHLWAHKVQPYARSKGTGNLFFGDDTIYSYGTHFPIARHVTNSRGESAVLFTTRTRSVTTAKHIRMVRAAIPDNVTVFNVVDLHSNDHQNRWVHYQNRILDTAKTAVRARTHRSRHLRTIDTLVNEANRYREFFSLINLPPMNVYLPLSLKKVFLRIKDKEIETSRGVRVPIPHAVKILPLIRSGRTYQHNEHPIYLGRYTIDSIDTKGNLWVKCHFIERAEIERIAAQLGL